MGAESISILNLLFLLILIIPVILINRFLGIHKNKDIGIAIIRMIIQLTFVGIYLQYLFDINNMLLNILYLMIMMGVATMSIIGSTSLKLHKVFIPIILSLLIPDFLILFFFNGVVVQVDDLFDAKYMITIGGMILGNGLSGNIIGLSTFYNSIIKEEETYRYELVMGATHLEALKPFFKEALLASVSPTIASTATIGLVSLPGMMTGQILGGSVPIEAIRYQIAIMIAILASKYINIFFAIWFTSKRMFDNKLQLNRKCFKEG